MTNECPKKFQPSFYKAQGQVGDAIRAAGFRMQCLGQYFTQRDAIEIFNLSNRGNFGIIMVRYIFPLNGSKSEPCGVFFFYDEGLVGNLAGANEYGTWASATKLLTTLIPPAPETPDPSILKTRSAPVTAGLVRKTERNSFRAFGQPVGTITHKGAKYEASIFGGTMEIHHALGGPEMVEIDLKPAIDTAVAMLNGKG
jgi:hypothetical protein